MKPERAKLPKLDSPRFESVVIDTNVLVAALRRGGGPNRRILRLCFESRLRPVVGQALLTEYESLLARDSVFGDCPLDASDRANFLDDFLSVCRWVRIRYRWRPNLRDEGDNHVLELAVAGQVDAIVTNNLRDFARGDLRFPGIAILSPRQILVRMEQEQS